MTVQGVIDRLTASSPHLAHGLLRLTVELEGEIGSDPLRLNMPDEPWSHDVFDDDLEEYEFVRQRLLDAAHRT